MGNFFLSVTVRFYVLLGGYINKFTFQFILITRI